MLPLTKAENAESGPEEEQERKEIQYGVEELELHLFSDDMQTAHSRKIE